MELERINKISEDYLRADQEYRIALAHAVVKHRGEGSDIVIRALADVDTEELLRDRLEKLIVQERVMSEHNHAVAEAHKAQAEAYKPLVRVTEG